MAIKAKIKYLRTRDGRVQEIVEERSITRSSAIKFKCLDCAGGLTADVRDCHISTCPLWHYRPYKTDSGDVEA